MKNSQLIKFKERLDELESKADEIDPDEFEEQVLKLEEEILEIKEMFRGDEEKSCNQLLKKIKDIKQEHDFYDEEAELDMMFPDRHDEDFDSDSMSPESVFGEE